MENITLPKVTYQTLPAPDAAAACRLPLVALQKLYAMPALAAMLPASDRTAGPGGARQFNEAQTIAARIVTSVKAAGGNIANFGAPLALSVMEKLDFSPSETAEVHVDCRANGYLACYIGNEAPDVAEAAGPSIWRMTFNIAAMRVEFRAALAARHASVKPHARACAAIEVVR